MNSRIKNTVLTVAAIALASIVLGKYVIVPVTGFKASWGIELLCGLIAMTCLAEIINIVTGICINIRQRLLMAVSVPKKQEDIRAAGIENPVDFAFFMCNILMYNRTPVFCTLETFLEPGLLQPPAVFKSTAELFEQRFERKPLGYETGDWNMVLNLESAEALKKDVNDVVITDALDLMSDKVLDQLRIKRVVSEEDEPA